MTARLNSIEYFDGSSLMKKLVVRFLLPLVCLVFLADAPHAESQSPPPSGGQAAAIFAVLIAVPVAVGFGVYYAVRSPRHVEGCVADQGGSLQLLDDKHRQYALSGETTGVKANRRVRLSGKAGKDAAKRRTFAVTGVERELGACGTP